MLRPLLSLAHFAPRGSAAYRALYLRSATIAESVSEPTASQTRFAVSQEAKVIDTFRMVFWLNLDQGIALSKGPIAIPGGIDK